MNKETFGSVLDIYSTILKDNTENINTNETTKEKLV